MKLNVNHPIETVPNSDNPEPIPCEFINETSGMMRVRITKPWVFGGGSGCYAAGGIFTYSPGIYKDRTWP